MGATLLLEAGLSRSRYCLGASFRVCQKVVNVSPQTYSVSVVPIIVLVRVLLGSTYLGSSTGSREGSGAHHLPTDLAQRGIGGRARVQKQGRYQY